MLKAIATEHGFKTKACSNVLNSLVTVAASEGHLHRPRSVPHQDQDEASYESMRKDDLWQGAEGEGKASKDGCESLPSCCPQEADLDECRQIGFGICTGSKISEWENPPY